jgi:hypothetical protein
MVNGYSIDLHDIVDSDEIPIDDLRRFGELTFALERRPVAVWAQDL